MIVTIAHDNDGFGSQMLSILSGIAYTMHIGGTYYHTPRKSIKLVGIDAPQNKEINRINEFLNSFMSNLGIKLISDAPLDEITNKVPYTIFPHLHGEVCNTQAYTKEFSKLLKANYPLLKPDYYENNHNIAVHIRRGDDLLPAQRHNRWISSDIYNSLIEKLHSKYPNSKLHVFSWQDPQIEVKSYISFHTTYSGDTFLDDYNALVWADILVVGSSTFSMSAGVINDKMVIIDESFYKLSDMYIPVEWKDNYRILMQ